MSGVAHASLVAVTDQTQSDAIKKATGIALQSTTVTCISGGKTQGYETSQFVTFINNADYVYRSDAGQPALQFLTTSTADQKYALSITTDAAGKKVVAMTYTVLQLQPDKTVNLGTIANPNLQVIPGQWTTTSDTSCTVK